MLDFPDWSIVKVAVLSIGLRPRKEDPAVAGAPIQQPSHKCELSRSEQTLHSTETSYHDFCMHSPKNIKLQQPKLEDKRSAGAVLGGVPRAGSPDAGRSKGRLLDLAIRIRPPNPMNFEHRRLRARRPTS